MNFKQHIFGAFTLAVSTAAQAQQINETPYPDEPTEVIVEADNYTVLKTGAYGGMASPNANVMITICPPSEMANLFSQTGAAVLLAQAKPEDIEQLYVSVFSEFIGNDDYIPHVNLSFIDDKGGLLPIYTPNNILDEFKKRASGEIPIPGSPAHTPALLTNINKHVQDFCFSNY